MGGPASAASGGRRNARLSVRLVLTYGLLVLATLLVVTALAVQLVRRHLTHELDGQLIRLAEDFRAGPASQAASLPTLAEATSQWLATRSVPEDRVVAVRVGERVLRSAGALDLRDVPGSRDMFEATTPRFWRLATAHAPIRGFSVPLAHRGGQIGTLVVAASSAPLDATVSALLRTLLLATGAGFAFAVLLGLAGVRRDLFPLTRLSRDIEEIQAAGDLSRRVLNEGSPEEVVRVTQAFNNMLERIEDLFRSHQEFLANTSHELRTPLTVARGKVELLAEAAREELQRRELTTALSELDRMGRLVDDLLLLARLDEGIPLDLQPVEVELVVREALLRGLQEGPRRAEVDAQPELYARADPERLLQVLTNLVSNAVRHGGPDARLHLAAQRQDGRVVIEVADTGPGIPAEELELIFERFYRVGPDAEAGTGLGLAISASLTRAMDGTIGVFSHRGQGTTFAVTLPLAEPPATPPFAADHDLSSEEKLVPAEPELSSAEQGERGADVEIH
ncbi:MAG: HAMP domain-containing histidine kinase [Actinomycetota bacterium]|nr:HAMP domain-containing histidine kinase [Actinomycetota bacterium]